MSTNPPNSRAEDQHYQTYWNGRPSIYHGSQLESTHDRLPSSTGYHESANSSAFKSNLQASHPISCGNKEPSMASVQNRGYAQDAKASTSDPPTGSPASGSPLTSQGFQELPLPLLAQKNGAHSHSDQRRLDSNGTLYGRESDQVLFEQANSDLEDGELSEGADQSSFSTHFQSRPQSTRLSSTKVNGTGQIPMPDEHEKHAPYLAPRLYPPAHEPTRGNHYLFGSDRMNMQQTNHGTAHAVTSISDTRASMDVAKQSLMWPSHRRQNKSPKSLQEGARDALQELRTYHIGYPQLLKEHVDPQFLRGLYTELNFEISNSASATETPTGAASHSLEAAALLHQNTSSDTPKKGPSIAVSSPLPPPTDLRSLADIGAKSLLPKHQQESREAAITTHAINGTSETSASQPASSTASMKMGATLTLPLQSRANAISGSNEYDPSNKVSPISPGANAGQHVTGESELKKPLQPLATNTASKPTISKAPVKTLDRKDYIARLLAAKAGKSLHGTGMSKPSPESTRQKSLDVPSTINDQASEVRQLQADPSPSKIPQDKGAVQSNIPMKTAPASRPAAEAKKREQTELARRRIQELKKRAKESKRAQTPAGDVPALSAPQPSSPQKSSREDSQDLTVPILSKLPPAQNMPQHSYFPLHNGTFTIPGLFMSSIRTQPEEPSDPASPIRTAQDTFQSPHQSKSRNGATPGTAQAPDQSIGVSQAPVSTQEQQDSGKEDTNTGISSKTADNPHKRSIVADSIESVPPKVRKFHNRKVESSVIFEVSDDDGDESENNDSAMQLDAEQGFNQLVARSVLGSRSGSTEYSNGRPLTARANVNGSMEQTNMLLGKAGQASQSSLKSKESDGLKYKEEEIERMNRKIAEMEQRRKSKQAIMVAQTPENPERPSSLPKSSEVVAGAQGGGRQVSETGIHIGDESRTIQNSHTQHLEHTLPKEAFAKERMTNIEQIGDVQHLEGILEKPITTMGAQQNQRQPAGVDSSVSSTDIAFQKIMMRLQTVQKEEADLQAQIQKTMDSKRALEKELEQLKQMSSLTPGAADRTIGKPATPPIPPNGHETGSGSPLQAVNDHKQSPAVSVSDEAFDVSQSEDMTAKHRDGPESSAPETALSARAPSNQSLISGELAEDVMDISGSEEDGVVSEPGFVSDAVPAPPEGESDDEEPYEPPASFRTVEEEDSLVVADSEQQRTGSGEVSQPFTPIPGHTPSLAESNAVGGVQTSATGAIIMPPLPGYAQTPAGLSDSEDYEPPEPTIPVVAAPVTHDAAAPVSESSSLLSSTDNEVGARADSLDPHLAGDLRATVDRAEATPKGKAKNLASDGNDKLAHFTPYESPLQTFHAYRYHPDFVSEVGNGYRSLTYSNAIDAQQPICPYEIDGRCNDASCVYQHFRGMSLTGALGEQDA
ncbi:MAG: hypothetical protein Q9181_000916 [Wetmoreana brouardii]